VIKYSNKLSGQCNATAQIEQVQHKKKSLKGRTGRHDTTEILLKVALNTINQSFKELCH
jgi:hypothetical protein